MCVQIVNVLCRVASIEPTPVSPAPDIGVQYKIVFMEIPVTALLPQFWQLLGQRWFSTWISQIRRVWHDCWSKLNLLSSASLKRRSLRLLAILAFSSSFIWMTFMRSLYFLWGKNLDELYVFLLLLLRLQLSSCASVSCLQVILVEEIPEGGHPGENVHHKSVSFSQIPPFVVVFV